MVWDIGSILYHIAYFALFLKSYIFIICIHIYSYIFMCWRCIHWQGYWVWYILHAMATVLLLSTSACHFGLSNDIPDVSLIFTGISVTSSVTVLVSSYCSQPEMLYVKVFLYWMYNFLHIYIDIIKFSSCIFIVTYMFLDVSVIISDILGIYCSIQTVIL